MFRFSFLSLIILTSITTHAQNSKPSRTLVAGSIGTGVVAGMLGKHYLAPPSTQAVILPMAREVTYAEVSRVVSPIENGDKIIVKFQFSPERSERKWIEDKRETINSFEASAVKHEEQAMTAMKTTYTTIRDPQGNILRRPTGVVPDYALRSAHAAEANTARGYVIDLENEIREVQKGLRSAPIFEMKREFQNRVDNKLLVENFIIKEAKRGSKFFTLTRIPKASLFKGSALVFVAILGTGVGIWELATGDVSRMLNSEDEKISDQ